MIALLILSAWVPIQDPLPEKIAEIVRRLSDDNAEVRDRARGELIRLGPSALETIQKHVVIADPALRQELKTVIAEIEKEVVLGEYKGSPSLITLKAERQTLKQVLESFGMQSRTPIAANGVPGDGLITLDLDRIPFFEAMDRVCRAHGGIRMRLEATPPPGGVYPCTACAWSAVLRRGAFDMSTASSRSNWQAWPS